MKNLKTVDTVREKESNRLIKLGFNCDAKNIVKNKYIDKIKKIEYCVRVRRKAYIAHSTLSFCVI